MRRGFNYTPGRAPMAAGGIAHTLNFGTSEVHEVLTPSREAHEVTVLQP